MRQELELALDKLDNDIHQLMIQVAKDFMADPDLDTWGDVLDSTGGVVTVLQARHLHAISSFLGCLLEGNVSMALVREQAGRLKEVFGEMVDDAVTQVICQKALLDCEGSIQ